MKNVSSKWLVISFVLSFGFWFEPASASELKKVTLPVTVLRWVDNSVSFTIKFPGEYPCRGSQTANKKAFLCPVEKSSFFEKPSTCSLLIAGTCDAEGFFGYPNPQGEAKDKFPMVYSSTKPLLSPETVWRERLVPSQVSVVLQVNSEGEVKSQELLVGETPFDPFIEKVNQEEKSKIEFRERVGSFIAIQISGPSQKITFKNKNPKGKPKKLILDRRGLRTEQEKLCYFQEQLICDTQGPVWNASEIGHYPERGEYNFPVIVIHVTSINGNTVEVPFRGNNFVGDVGPNFQVLSKKGSRVEKDKADLEQQRDKQLENLGVSSLRRKLANCLIPQLKNQDCFKGIVALDGIPFDDRRYPPGPENQQLTLAQFHEAMKNQDLKSMVEACATKKFAKRVITKNEVTFYFDEKIQNTYFCKFKKVNDQWILLGIYSTEEC
ncbi:hypothetical protein EBR03_04900 [bacterium]|nr:hypothetical protein [bacterium]